MSWAMTDGEIASMWRTCKDRNEQVNILADLNVKSRAEMLGKLRELGYDGGKAVIRCDGQEVREALVRVLYAGDGSVDSVELELGV